ncbi:hypothetical protein Zmor_027970 [Zophobas morio]|uniref:CIDE-N domain-containing protein n=1 Tax=Zophobas morio TaxID=2755281 RepID=A0AA38HP61_9CUCU|nr:hypothetical protein Zmor_027970 [Zophobas morio]
MCAFYALKLIARDDVENFEMTTNNAKYEVFDDIELNVKFRNGKTCTYLFQFKHKTGANSITIDDLKSENQRDFCVKKYCNSLSSLRVKDDVVCILSTNSSTDIKQNTQISTDIILEARDYIENEDLLLNVRERKPSNVFQVVEKLDDKTQMFYFFTEQNDTIDTKVLVQKMLDEMLQCDVYDSFMQFMGKWWSKNVVLSKDDVIAKLTELALSPYIKSLSGDKQNAKTENLRKAIMNYSLTIVENSGKNVVQNVWPDVHIEKEVLMKIRDKFELGERDQFKMKWFLGKVPLIVELDDWNKTTVGCVIKVMNKSVEKRQIILVGKVTKGQFDGMDVLQDLSDLMNKAENDKHCRDILSNFHISLQGKEPVCLEKFIHIDREIAKHIGVGELLKMSQATYIIGNETENLPELRIPESVSTTFVNTEKMFTLCESEINQTTVIINWASVIEDLSLTLEKHNFVEISDYLSQEYVVNDNVIILSRKSKVTHTEFLQVCEKSKKSNVYLLQMFDYKSCILLLKKGNELPSDVIDEPKSIPEWYVLKYFDSPLNVVCVPSGMDKSTLMKVLYRKCPSHYWAIYVDLININSFLAKKPDSTTMWNYFLSFEKEKETMEEQIKNILLRNKRLYLFLDGLDKVEGSYINCVLNFAKEASSNGINIWISSREDLRDRVSQALNTVPLRIQQLDEEYFSKRLKEKYKNDAIYPITKMLLESGASINTLDKENKNVLHHVIDSQEDNGDVVKLLIEKGIDVNAQDRNGTTALQLACRNGNYENTEMLLNFGASINTADNNNNNALHYALESSKDTRDVIKLLIAKGIDVNAQNKSGTPALHLPTKRGDDEITKMGLHSAVKQPLLQKEANIQTCKPFKITNSTRETHKGIMASSLEELTSKVKEKLHIFSGVTMVLDSDGTEIDDEDYFSTLQPNTTLMVLEEGQKWMPVALSCRRSVDQVDGVQGDEVMELVDKLQHNLCHLALLRGAELELLTDMNLDSFQNVTVPERVFLEHVKEASGRLLSEKREAQDALDCLRLYRSVC